MEDDLSRELLFIFLLNDDVNAYEGKYVVLINDFLLWLFYLQWTLRKILQGIFFMQSLVVLTEFRILDMIFHNFLINRTTYFSKMFYYTEKITLIWRLLMLFNVWKYSIVNNWKTFLFKVIVAYKTMKLICVKTEN